MPESRTGESLESILREFQGRKGVLLEVFHRVQDAYGYVPSETIEPIAKALHMHSPTVYGTLTFYTEFRTAPPPDVQINMCLGPTCHEKGAEVIKQILEHHLDIASNGISPDNAYGIHVVQCAGHCHMAPLLYLNGEVRGRVGVGDARSLIEEARRQAETANQ